MKKNLKLGAVSWGLPGAGLFSPRLAKDVGLDGIQLELGSYESGYPLSQKAIAEYFLEEADLYGVEYPSLVLNDLMLHEFIEGPNTENGKIAYEQIEIGIQAAVMLNIKFVMLPNFGNNLIISLEHLENTIKALAYSCDLAASKGIVILSETTLDWKTHKLILEQVGRSNLQIFFDSMNYKFFSKIDQCEQLKKIYGSMAQQLHTKDGIDYPGGALLGEGDMDFSKQMDILKAAHYTGWIIIENYYNQYPLSSLNAREQISLLIKDVETLKSKFFF